MPGSASGSDLILNLRKPIGWSSFDVVRLVKKQLPGIKVGHAGTLDPFAEGVLLICSGQETKSITALVNAEKEYTARLRLGFETDTLDISGKIVAQKKCPPLELEQVMHAASRFNGEIEQVPPRFSAIHFQGQRLYKLARAGVQETPEPRRVVIHCFKIVCVTESYIDFSVSCSKGTYIRSLARDFAQTLGTSGFLSHLIRTRIGAHTIQESLEVADLANHIKNRL